MRDSIPALLKGLQATSLWMCNLVYHLVSHQVTMTSYSSALTEPQKGRIVERCMSKVDSEGPSMVFGHRLYRLHNRDWKRPIATIQSAQYNPYCSAWKS